jgi:hypothetical protein
MKAIISIELNNDAFAQGGVDYELSRVLNNLADKVLDNVVCDIGHMTTAQDVNGNTVARLDIVSEEYPNHVIKKEGQKLNVDPADKYIEMKNESWADSNVSDPY